MSKKTPRPDRDVATQRQIQRNAERLNNAAKRRLKTGKPEVKSNLDPNGVLAPLRANAQVAKNLVGDFTVVGRSGDTVFSLIPNTPAAEAWVSEHLPENAMRFGRGICIEHRYIGAILEGLQADGLKVTQ